MYAQCNSENKVSLKATFHFEGLARQISQKFLQVVYSSKRSYRARFTEPQYLRVYCGYGDEANTN